MRIDFVVSFSEHAKERLKQRYKNLKVNDLLGLELEDVDKGVHDILVDTCKAKARRQVLDGYTRIKVFTGVGICCVVDSASLEVITVFPNANSDVVRQELCIDTKVNHLNNKLSQVAQLKRCKINLCSIGVEIDRINKSLTSLKKDKKIINIKKSHDEKLIKYEALRDFVINRFGAKEMQKFYDTMN